MGQLKITLPDDLRADLDAACAASGFSLAEEIRSRVERTLKEDAIDPVTRSLMNYVVRLANLIKAQTNRLDWYSHPAAHRTFRYGLVARLAHIQPEGEPLFGPGDLPPPPIRLVIGEGPEAIGQALEALDFNYPKIDPERLRAATEKTVQDMLALHPDLAKQHPELHKDEEKDQ